MSNKLSRRERLRQSLFEQFEMLITAIENGEFALEHLDNLLEHLDSYKDANDLELARIEGLIPF